MTSATLGWFLFSLHQRTITSTTWGNWDIFPAQVYMSRGVSVCIYIFIWYLPALRHACFDPVSHSGKSCAWSYSWDACKKCIVNQCLEDSTIHMTSFSEDRQTEVKPPESDCLSLFSSSHVLINFPSTDSWSSCADSLSFTNRHIYRNDGKLIHQ